VPGDEFGERWLTNPVTDKVTKGSAGTWNDPHIVKNCLSDSVVLGFLEVCLLQPISSV